MDPLVQLFVQLADGPNIMVEAESTDTVARLKEIVYNKRATMPCAQGKEGQRGLGCADGPQQMGLTLAREWKKLSNTRSLLGCRIRTGDKLVQLRAPPPPETPPEPEAEPEVILTELQRSAELFAEIDSDGNAGVSIEELQTGLRARGLNVGDDSVAAFEAQDKDGDGTIDFDEWQSSGIATAIDKLARYSGFGENRGTLNHDQAVEMLLDVGVPHKHVYLALRKLDKDRDGTGEPAHAQRARASTCLPVHSSAETT